MRKEMNLNDKNVIHIYENYKCTKVEDLIVTKKQTIIIDTKLIGGSEVDPDTNHKDSMEKSCQKGLENKMIEDLLIS